MWHTITSIPHLPVKLMMIFLVMSVCIDILITYALKHRHHIRKNWYFDSHIHRRFRVIVGWKILLSGLILVVSTVYPSMAADKLIFCGGPVCICSLRRYDS